MTGWIKLHRSLQGSAIASHPEYLAVWVHLLMRAQHGSCECVIGRQVVTLSPGQLVFGRIKFSAEIGVSENKVRAALDVMKSLNMITIKSMAKFSIISITKWQEYQQQSPANNHETASKPPADSQQTATYKNVKNDNNVENLKELSPQQAAPPSKRASRLPDDWRPTSEYWQAAVEIKPDATQEWFVTVAHKFKDYWIAKSGKDATKANWLAAWRNWIRREVENEKGRTGKPGKQSYGEQRSELFDAVTDYDRATNF